MTIYKLEIQERVNILKANYLYDSFSLKEFEKTFIGTKKDAKLQFTLIQDYLKNIVVHNNNYVIYTFAHGRKDGRLISPKSLQNCNRNIRGFLCQDISTDIDIKNAHPAILKQLCDKYHILCPNLEFYIRNRDTCLKNIMRDCNYNKSEAKISILISTNENKIIRTNSEFLKNYDKEIKKIQKQFLNIDDFDYIKKFAKKDSNFEGSFINHILCIHENIILSAMREFCKINNYEIQALMFDGLMIYGVLDNDTLKLMENYIHKYTEFENIELSIKEHETTFTLPPDYKVKPKIQYNELKKHFEKNNCKVNDYFICEKHGRKTEYNDKKFKVLHQELSYFDYQNDKSKSFIDEWFNDIDKRNYDFADSFPKKSLCPEWCYNLWIPYPVENMDKQNESERNKRALKMFLEHINVLTNFNPIHSNFVILWLKQMFQFPENKSIELIFISEEGAGKGTFLKFLSTIMGGCRRVWECTDPLRDIFGDFNDNMVDAMLVCFNESNKANFYNSNDKKKALITDPTININMKGGRKFVMKSYHRFLLFSNNPDPNNKNKRRDFTMRCSDSKINDFNYWKEINDYADDISCCKYIYDYLMETKVQETITKIDIPVGNYDSLLQEVQRHHVFDWLDEFIYNERRFYLNKKEQNLNTDNYILKSTYLNQNLFDEYKTWCDKNNINSKYYLELQNFSMKIFGKAYNSINRIKKKAKGKVINCFEIIYPSIFDELGIDLNQENDYDSDDFD